MKYKFLVKGEKDGEQLEKLFEDAQDALMFLESCGWDNAASKCMPVEETSQETAKSKGLRMRGRDAVARYLVHAGYEIAERDYATGECSADFVAFDGDVLVFFEVCTSSHMEHGFKVFDKPGKDKLARMEKMAMAYLGAHDYVNVPVHFDAIAIVPVGSDRAFLKHYVNHVNEER